MAPQSIVLLTSAMRHVEIGIALFYMRLEKMMIVSAGKTFHP